MHMVCEIAEFRENDVCKGVKAMHFFVCQCMCVWLYGTNISHAAA